jgi:hypothetical protein
MTLPEECAHVAAAYYALVCDADLSADDFAAFLSHLPPKAQAAVGAGGFEANRHLLPFRRYVLEQRGRPMPAYMQEHLSSSAWNYWQTLQ